jgi:hypothetical protein
MKTTLLSDFRGAGAMASLVLQNELFGCGEGAIIDFFTPAPPAHKDAGH